MSRLADLLIAASAAFRAERDDADKLVFTEVRAELDRFDLTDLLKDSTRAPTARVCLMRAKPVPGIDGGRDLDVSVAIVVVAGRSGRANPEFSSADMAALDLLDICTDVLMRDPYVGLGQLQAAELGDQLVALSEQSNKEGFAIALQEVKWRLLQVKTARAAIRSAIGTSDEAQPDQLAINGNEPVEPPVGYVPPVTP